MLMVRISSILHSLPTIWVKWEKILQKLMFGCSKVKKYPYPIIQVNEGIHSFIDLLALESAGTMLSLEPTIQC